MEDDIIEKIVKAAEERSKVILEFEELIRKTDNDGLNNFLKPILGESQSSNQSDWSD